MAAISQPQDTKRRGLLSLFSRKTKSSTGDSSVSSGSARERSVSPARSDESGDGRPTPRPLSLASSSATLTAAQPQLSRPASIINLAKNRKRQAPAPPPPPSASTPTPAPAPHTNGKEEGERGEGGGTSLSRRSSDSSGYHEADQRSPYTSPAGSEISSAEAARTAQVPQATNLTTVVSTSSLSLSSSRGKRRAPPPPKPPPTRQDESCRPSAIPEESESPAPTKSSSKEDTPLANGEAHHDPPQQHQPDNHPSSPTSSHVSSVSSLSSVEQQQANHPRLPPPPDVECPPAPPSSERTNLGTTLSNSPQPSSATHFSSNITPLHQSFSNTYKPLSPTDARITVAAGVTLGMHHEAATAVSLSHTTDSSKLNSTASGIISPDRLAESEALQHHGHHDHPSLTQAVHQHSSQGLPSASSVSSEKQQKPSTEIIQERNYLGAIQAKKYKESYVSFPGDGVSAKIDFSPNDDVMPENDDMESIPEIPTFRIVTKSHTGLQKEDDVSKKFIADGKTQKVSEEDKFGSKSKSAKNSSMNPLARGKKLVRQNNIVYDDEDLDLNEDIFEPRNVFGISMSSVDLSVEGSPVTEQNKNALSLTGYQLKSSTPVKIAAPLPTPRSNAPEPPSHSISAKKHTYSITDQHTPLMLPSIANVETYPKLVPRTQIPQKKKAPPPPVAVQIAKVSISTRQAFPHKEELQASQDESLSFALQTNCNDSITSCDTSQSSHVLESKEFEQIVHKTSDEEFKVHFSELSKVDYDMLSLLSEEGIDSISVSSRQSPRSSISSKKSDSSRENENAPIVPAQNDKTVKAPNLSSTIPSHISLATSSPVPPITAHPAQTTASSYRAGYLAMMAELTSWKDSDSLHNVELESDSDSSNIRNSLQELPKVMGSLQETSEGSAQISQVSCEGVHRGSSLRPRLVSSSSLCSDTDHEVQTRTASFSSETSEENVTSGRVKPSNTPVEDNLPGEECPIDIQKISEKEFMKNVLKETEIINEQNNANDDQSTNSKRKTDALSVSNCEDYYQSDVQQKEITVLTKKLEFTKKLDAPLLRENVVCSQPQEKSNFTNGTVIRNVSLQSVSSLSVTDSEGDDGGNITQRLTGECEKLEMVNTEVFELPRSTIKTSTVGRAVHESSDDTSLNLINDRNTGVSSGSRKSSVSSASSASNESSTSTNHIELTPQVSQEVTKKKIESHLLAAFAELKGESKLSELTSEELPMQSSVKMLSDLPLSSSDNNWDYKMPDPPTPFKDGPSSRVADDSSSISSEPVPEILTDVPSGFKDSSGSSLSESRNVNIIERADSLKQMQTTKETSDLVSSASSSLSSISYKSEEKAKQNVINELKSTIKETNNNEPRIVELKPKIKGMETVLQMHKSPSKEAIPSNAKIQAKDIETQEAILPVRAAAPVQHTYVPRVVAKGLVDSMKSHALDNPHKINKSSNEAIFSHESCCNSPEPEVASLHSRSGSSTSYGSAPTPVPAPSDSEFEARASRSSSDVSDGRTRSTKSKVARQNSGSASEAGRSRERAMNFSISTYTSRSEETSYDKKITKSESFNHPMKPKLGQLSKMDSFSTHPKSDELKEDKRDDDANNETSITSKPSIDLEKPSLPKKPHWSEFTSAPVKHSPFLVKPAHSAKPTLPPNKPTLFGMHSETNLNINQPVARVNSLGDRPAIYRNSRGSHFPAPDPPRPLRRLKRTDSQEQLERTTSLINLATPNYELRKAQSSYDVSYGSGGNDNGAGNGMSGMPGMPGIPGMFGMQSMGGDGMMPHDARLADEFMKLQQDFFKWQQQLLQNQHVLHSRVAPLASNPPQLQSVGVLRDIMSQTPSSANGGPELIEARNPSIERKGPVERVINIQFEDGPRETDDSQVRTTSIPRLNQNVHNITTNMGQLSTNDFGMPSNAQPRRWGEEPSVSVGAWMERPPQSVGVYQDRDYVTSAPRSQSTQDLSSPPVSDERQRTPPRTTFVGPRGYSRPADSVKPETKPYQWTPQQQDQVTRPLQYQFLPPDQQQQFVQFVQQQQPQQQWQQPPPLQQQQAQQQPPKPQFVQPQQQPLQQQQPQQQPPKPQFVQPQQPPPKPQFVQPQPDKTAFWRELEEKRQDLGVQNDQDVSEPTRPPRRNSRQDSPPQDPEVTRPLTYFGQKGVVQEPPPAYYYNGDGNSLPPNIANIASVTRPKEVEPEVGGPRYTSVVTLSDKNEQPAGAPPVKDKVRSVVQLNSNDQRGQPRTAPVVRGFRQPGEEPPNQGGTIHSRIISNALKNSQPSQPQTRSSVSPPSVNGSVPTALSTQVPEAPTAARLVAALPKAPLPSHAVTRISPPRTSPSRISPPRTSPVRTSPICTPPSRISPPSGPAFPIVQLRPVPAGLRATTPPESSITAPPQLPPAAVASSAPGNQFGGVPTPPPPAPPMAPPPPPPPAPKAMSEERRTASGKKIISSKTGPELDAREELMMAIKNHGGMKGLRRTRT